MTKREDMIKRLSNQANATVENYNGATIICYDGHKRPCVAIYSPFRKGIKPAYDYAFATVAERTAFIADKKVVIDNDAKMAEARMLSYAADAEKIQTGSILYSSWGYEQTNIDFFKVISRKGMNIVMQQIGSKLVNYNGIQMSGQKIADESVLKGEPMNKRINKFGTITLNSFSFCGVWDGQPKSFSNYA